MGKSSLQWCDQQRFDPGLIGLLINPFYFARRGLVHALRPMLGQLTGEVLDVGCGRKPYQHFTAASRYVGIDLDTPELRALGAADLFFDGKSLPVITESFDAVVCSEVLEHVFTPTAFLDEIWRVLRPGGRLVLTTPFVWDEHSQPWDFGRYSSFGLRHLLEKAGFEITEQRKTCADARAVVQLVAAYLYKVFLSRHRCVNRFVQLAVIAPISIIGELIACLLPSNPDLYIDNVILARKANIPPTEIGQISG